MRPIFTLTVALAMCLPLLTRAGEADALVIGPRPLTLTEIAHYSARLKDPDDKKFRGTTHELARLARPGTAKLLLDHYINNTARRREACVSALGGLGDKSQIDALVKIAVGDSSPEVRMRASFSCRHLAKDSRELFKALIKHADNDPQQCARALSAVAFPARASDPLLELLDSKHIDLAISAAAELGGVLPDVELAEALMNKLSSENLEIRTACAESLERMSGQKFGFDLVKWAEWVKSDMRLKDKGYVDRSVDLMIVFDTSGSFLHVWADVSRALESVLRELAKTPYLRIGIVRYRSIDPRATLKYSLDYKPLTYDTDAMRKQLTTASFGGGSGALHEGLRAAIFKPVWRAHARRIVLLIGDDSPSSPVENGLKVCLQLADEAPEFQYIQIHTLFAKTSAGEEHRQTYRSIANASGGLFYEFNKAERHLVDMSAAKVNVKQAELPAETARKWVREP